MLPNGRISLARISMNRSSSEQVRDSIEAEFLLSVVFAHMACRTTKSVGEDLSARARFIDAVRALYDAVVGDIKPLDSDARTRFT